MRSLRRTVFALALAAGLTLGTAGTAAAASLTDLDQRGDVHTFQSDSETPVNSPDIKNGDVVRTVLKHGVHRVSARVKFADLRRIGVFHGDVLSMVTNEGVRRDVTIFAGPYAWRGEADMTRPNGRSVSCDLKHKIDYDKNVVTVSFPRSCISNPRWVRLGFGTFWAEESSDNVHMDDALLDGRLNSQTLKFSPRLRRG